MATARFVVAQEAATARISVKRLIFPDGFVTLAWRSFIVVCKGTGVLVTFVFWIICIRAEEVFMNFSRSGLRALTL
jgi:hypothetical protein